MPDAWSKHCPLCGRLWFWTLKGDGCLTKGCPNKLDL
jgi:hypothetical protein